MKELEFISFSPEDTARIAAEFAQRLRGGNTVVLAGELGAGKTAFVKGIAAAIGIEPDRVLSPTFVLLRTHAGALTLNHCDLYRLMSAEEVYEAGIVELIGREDAVLLVEWADVILTYLKNYYLVSVTVRSDGARVIRIGENE